jgi:hypothetical protein
MGGFITEDASTIKPFLVNSAFRRDAAAWELLDGEGVIAG